MDLMYGCGGLGSSSAAALREMMEGELKCSRMDDIVDDLFPPGKSLEDFMLEDLNSGSDPDGDGDDGETFLFGEEGLEEFGMRFDNRSSSLSSSSSDAFDIFDHFLEDSHKSSCSSANNSIKTNKSNISSARNGVSRIITSGSSNTIVTTATVTTPVTSVLNGKAKAVSVSMVKDGKISKLVLTGSSSLIGGNGIVTKTATRHIAANSNNNSNSSKSSVLSSSTPSIYVWSLRSADTAKGISFEEGCGIMVDPSSIVPASVSGSAGSSSIGSEETDAEFLATDDESENEVITGQGIAAWIVPDNAGSRSPTPEYELEEPEFIMSAAGSHVFEPPTKRRKQKHEPQPDIDGRIYPKPGFSYSCLIAMSLKNSKTGCLPVSEIYKFMCDHFPYFKTAPSGWKNSVRHNLSLNKCFEKIEKPGNGARKGCLWALNPAKIHKMDEEVQKWSRKDPMSIKRAMSDPENLDLLERGELKRDYSGEGSDEDEDDGYSEANSTLIPVDHSSEPKIQIKKEMNPIDFDAISRALGGTYHRTSASSTTPHQTYTLQFSNLTPTTTTTPIIIRRTPVK